MASIISKATSSAAAMAQPVAKGVVSGVTTVVPPLARGIVSGASAVGPPLARGAAASVSAVGSAALSGLQSVLNAVPNITLPRSSQRVQQQRIGFAPSTSRYTPRIADSPRDSFLQRLDSVLTDIAEAVSDDRQGTIQQTIVREGNDFAFGRQSAHRFLERVWNRVREFDTVAAANDVTVNILGPLIEAMGLERSETLVNPKKGKGKEPVIQRSTVIEPRRSARVGTPTVFTSAGGGQHIVIEGQQVPVIEDLVNNVYRYKYMGEQYTFPRYRR